MTAAQQRSPTVWNADYYREMVLPTASPKIMVCGG
jgi:hypothetical protein